MESSDEYDSDNSYSEVENQMATMTALMALMTDDLDAAEKQLTVLQPELEDSYITNLQTVSFLEKSSFRHQTFLFKAPGIPGVNLTKRYAFKDILELLREYLYKTKAVANDGTITLSKQLRTLFGIKEEKTTYLEMIGKLRNILV